MFLTDVPALPVSQNVYISKSHSPNTRLSYVLSSFPIKAGEHGSSMNFQPLAGLKHLPYCFQSLLWSASVHKRMYSPLRETWEFPGQALVDKCSLRAVSLHLPGSVSPYQCWFKLYETVACVGTLRQGEKEGWVCIRASLAPPSLRLVWCSSVWGCVSSCFLVLPGTTACLLL